jgi:type IV secretion system protein TrbL
MFALVGFASIFTAPFKLVGGLLGGLAGSAAGDIIAAIAKAIMQSLNQAIETVGTLWVNVGTPNLTSSAGGSSPSDAVGYIQGHLFWYTVAGAVAGVLVGCGRMAWEQRAAPGRDVLRGLVTLVAVSGAGLTVLSLAVSAADAFSGWIIGQAIPSSSTFGTALTGLLGLTAASSGFGAILVIVLGLFMLLASLIQIFLMVVRGGMLVLLAGVLPTTAAFTNTQAGREWFRKSVGWMVAFVLYKPVAAVIYATAFRLASSNVFGQGGLLAVITGLTLMIIALLALPALMRFVAPMVGAAAGGGAGAMLGAAAAGAAIAMPTGALRQAFAGRVASGGMSAGGGSGGPGPSGAGGAPGGGMPLPGGGGGNSGGVGTGAMALQRANGGSASGRGAGGGARPSGSSSSGAALNGSAAPTAVETAVTRAAGAVNGTGSGAPQGVSAEDAPSGRSGAGVSSAGVVRRGRAAHRRCQ